MMFMKIEKTITQQRKKILIVSDYMIADMKANKKLGPKVTELFLRDRKLNISIAFVSQSYFTVSKTKRGHKKKNVLGQLNGFSFLKLYPLFSSRLSRPHKNTKNRVETHLIFPCK